MYKLEHNEFMNSVSIVPDTKDHEYDYFTLFFHGTIEGVNGHTYAVWRADYAADYTSRKRPKAKLWYAVGSNLMGYNKNGEYADITLHIPTELQQTLNTIPEWALGA